MGEAKKRQGSWFSDVEDLANRAASVPGDFAELGVWHGETYNGLRDVAHRAGKLAWAIDSWQGMPEPSERDADATGHHWCPKGSVSPGGEAGIQEILDAAHTAGQAETVVIVEGWIPDVLDTLPDDLRFCFVHLDIDQYDSTAAALRWIWPRINPGGILVCHDWFPGRAFLAAGAIQAWLDECGLAMENRPQSFHGWVTK